MAPSLGDADGARLCQQETGCLVHILEMLLYSRLGRKRSKPPPSNSDNYMSLHITVVSKVPNLLSGPLCMQKGNDVLCFVVLFPSQFGRKCLIDVGVP